MAPLLPHQAFGLGHQLFADAAALQARADREHAEIAGVALIGDMRAGDQFAIAFGQQHHAAVAQDVLAKQLGFDAGAVEQVGLGRPADAAGIAAVGRGNQDDQRIDVGNGGGTEGERMHGAIVAVRHAGGAGPASARPVSAQQLAHLAQGRHELLDLLVRVVERQRGPASRRHAVELQQRMRAMLARADRHAFQVQQRRQVVRVRALDQERDHGGLVRRSAEDAQAFDALQFFGQMRQQFGLARLDVVQADRVEVVHRRAQANEAGDVRRTGLELVRALVEHGALETDFLDHLATAPGTAASPAGARVAPTARRCRSARTSCGR